MQTNVKKKRRDCTHKPGGVMIRIITRIINHSMIKYKWSRIHTNDRRFIQMSEDSESSEPSILNQWSIKNDKNDKSHHHINQWLITHESMIRIIIRIFNDQSMVNQWSINVQSVINQWSINDQSMINHHQNHQNHHQYHQNQHQNHHHI